jgi:FkbM family methyltransferase
VSLAWIERRWRRVCRRVLRVVHPRVDVAIRGARLTVDLRDRKLGRMLYEGRSHEAALADLFECADLEGAVCIDVGANFGLHTLPLSRLVGPRGHVYAFEPAPASFSLLAHNLRRNGAVNVTAYREAAGEGAGSGRLAFNPRNHGDNRLGAGAPAAWARAEVPVVAIDERLADVAPGRIALVKIDVQGWECHVLRGMRATLARNPQALVAIEVFPAGLREAGASGAELTALIRDLGLRGWEFGADRLAPMHEPWVYDLLRGAVDVVVSRESDRLESALQRWRRAPLRPADQARRGPGPAAVGA